MKVTDFVAGTKASLYAENTAAAKDKETKAKEKTAANGPAGDRVEISPRSREIARVQELVQTAPEMRVEKVARLKSEYEAGTYNVQSEKVANALLASVLTDKA